MKNYRYYKKLFDEIMATMDKNLVYDKKGNSLLIEEDEVFKQCYSKEKSNLAINQLPKYWFISNKGRLLSLYNGDIKIIKPESGKRPSYKIKANKSNKLKHDKNISCYSLVGLVFNCSCTPKAQRLIEKKGLEILGCGKVECHHIRGYDNQQSLAYNCDPQYLQFIEADVHDLLSTNINNKKESEFIERLYKDFGNSTENFVVVFLEDKNSSFKGKVCNIYNNNKYSINDICYSSLNNDENFEKNKL